MFLPRTICEVALAWQEQAYRPLVHYGLHSVQRSSGLSAPINLYTVPASGRTSDFGRRVGQLTLGCARTEAVDSLGRPATQPNLTVVRRTRTAQERALVRTKPLIECRRDLSPFAALVCRVTRLFQQSNLGYAALPKELAHRDPTTLLSNRRTNP